MSSEEVNITIEFSHQISLIRYLGNSMAPLRMTIKTEVFPSEIAEEIDFDITFAKIKFWFDTIVARSVVFCRTNTTAMEMLLTETGKSRLVNHLMITPYEPTDEHLAVIFQSKMSALSKGTIEFGCVRVAADDGGLVFTYIGDWHDDLPTMEDWYNVKPYYFTKPWWQREDASTMDIMADGADISQLPSWSYRFDFIDAAIRPPSNTEAAEADNVVIRGAFRPKIIAGGRDDE